MAKSTPRRPKKPVPINSSIALEDPPADIGDGESIQTTPFDPEPVPEPPPPARAPAQAKTPTFFENMKRISKQDWGPRATIYLYRVEPIIDRTRSGDNKYIQTYAEPINEDRIMADFGSGRYKLILNIRKQGADVGDILDSTYMDILNMKYPPKIPVGEWTDDPRNKRWQWAKEASQPAPAAPVAPGIEIKDAFGTFMDIQDRIEERIKPAAVPATPAAAPVDPWAAAERILNMRSDNPMVELWKQQMAANQAAMEAERERQFKSAEAAKEREFKLQQDLLAAKQSNGNGKGIIEQLIEAAPLLEKLEPLKKFLGIGGVIRETADGAERVVRATKMGTFEFIADIAPKIIDAPIVNALAAKIMSGMQNGPAPVPAMNGAHPQQQRIQQPAPDQFEQWLVIAGNPALMEHFTNGAEGGDLAEWIFWSRPDYLQRIQRFTHPAMPGMIGAPAIIRAYQNTPEVWSHIKGKEIEFGRFIDQLCAWTPEEEPDEPGVIQAKAEPADEWEQGESRPS